MDKLIDYMKYTTALAVGLLLYVPATFIPAQSPWERLILLGLMLVVVIAILSGVMLYARATTIAVTNPPEDGKPLAPDWWIKRWGWIHIIAVLIAFAVVTPFFFYYKVLSPVTPLECKASFSDAAGRQVELSFPCSS